ncbi:GAF domain-containing protein [Leptolyngbya sp. FACHB-261]|uniref:GAF domain-containing protein n=1 Tax=Leptolyngbya sp. FACHB-261 TaxID=2692806 RepID=UPI001682E51D|nr:GAF domain-containing protein [Leptolyngbya sp. FACHB-261]MBD2104099.1 GAF domain-containing protein [Leptolyngbya sp. FACHB-261]
MSDVLPQNPLTIPVPLNESERLAALYRYNILDTPPEAAFDRITALAARLFGMPIALVSLIDESRGWFKSAYGIDLKEVQRDATICSLALLSSEVLVIPDTRQDYRLTCNPFVQNEPGLRFYAGAPLLTRDGFNLGTLCLLDTKPRDALTDEQQEVLSDLAAMVVDELELRLAARRVAQIDRALLQVTQGVAAAIGEAFFSALVQHFTQTLGVDYTYIGLVSGDHQESIRTIAACAKGQIIDNFEYLLQDTPCREIIQNRKLCSYPKGVQAQFPNAPLLEPLNVESYVAIPFFDSIGTPLGLLGVMDGKPLENIQLAESLLTIFALRIATELERQQTEAARQQAQHELERLVQQRTAELSRANELLHLEIAERQQTEVTLQREQETLKVLLDNVQAGIVACNAEGTLTLFNQAAREFHGLPEQPPPTEQWATHYDLYLPDGKTRMPKEEIPLFRALQGETVDNVEMVIVPKQGTAQTLLASGQTILDAQGKKQGAVIVMHDITERKRAEEERAQLVREQAARAMAEVSQQQAAFLAEVSSVLASSLEYEQTLQSVANLAVPYFADWCSVDLLNDDCSISRVAVGHSDPEKVKLGWEVAQRYPRHLSDGDGISKVMQTGQSEIVPEITDEQLVASVPDPGYLQILRGLGLKSCIVAPLKARGRVLGSISFVFSESNRHYSLVNLDLAEELARCAAVAIDNARLYHMAQQAKQAAETAAERTARLQTVTAALSESLTPKQVAGVIVEQSMAALEATAALVVLVSADRTELEIVKSIGYQADLVESWRRFSINVDVPLAEAVRTGEPQWMETLANRIACYPHLAHIYSRYDFDSWMSLPLVVEGKSVGGMLLSFKEFKQLSQDEREFILALSRQCAQAISRAQSYEAERNARAEAEQANRVKDEFLAVLSHELRTPLNPILGWSKLLQNQKHDNATLTRGLQTIERNAKLQTQLIEDLLDVSRILRGKLSLNVAPVDLKPTLEAAMETVRLAAEAKAIQIQTQLNPTVGCVSGDADRLQQVVWNLLSNAVKFTPRGGQVQITLEQIDSQAQIQVSDTGKGITPEFLPYIFERFRQADSKTTREFGGLGLGLAIVRQLVELHGGTVQVDSAGEGQGTTFTVRLPLLPGKVKNVKDEKDNLQSLASRANPLQGVRILVVDDETDARELLVFVLEQAGAIVAEVTSVAEALQTFEQTNFDLLISDIGMPEMDGYMLMKQVRALEAEAKKIPAIALTAYAGDFNQQQALQAGFQKHISKPVEPSVLITNITALINR